MAAQKRAGGKIMTAAIKVANLAHTINRTPILTDIFLEAARGTFFIITGPNGSGKTTLMKLMAGVMKKKRGDIIIDGIPLEKFSDRERARKTAFVPQLTSADFPFTVREIVMAGRSPHQGILGLENKKDGEIVAGVLEFTEMTYLADRTVDRLSGGERQRAMIARAICQEPDIILLDEPTSALDMSHQIRVMDLMEKLKREKNTTIVMISHDINLSAMYADTILLLRNGRVVDTGTPEKVLTTASLEDVYDCSIFIDQSPFGQAPRVLPVPGKFRK